MVILGFAEDEAKTLAPSDVMQKQLADAIKIYEDKKETYLKDVLDLFERKEKELRDKADLKMLNLIKKEKDLFIKEGKGPTLFFITDQKRNLELSKSIYTIAQKKYEQGVGSNLEIINAQTSLKESETNYFNAIYDLLIYKVDYLKATGNSIK